MPYIYVLSFSQWDYTFRLKMNVNMMRTGQLKMCASNVLLQMYHRNGHLSPKARHISKSNSYIRSLLSNKNINVFKITCKENNVVVRFYKLPFYRFAWKTLVYKLHIIKKKTHLLKRTCWSRTTTCCITNWCVEFRDDFLFHLCGFSFPIPSNFLLFIWHRKKNVFTSTDIFLYMFCARYKMYIYCVRPADAFISLFKFKHIHLRCMRNTRHGCEFWRYKYLLKHLLLNIRKDFNILMKWIWNNIFA